jgi:hypothetical protein
LIARRSGIGRTCDAQVASDGNAEPGGNVEKWFDGGAVDDGGTVVVVDVDVVVVGFTVVVVVVDDGDVVVAWTVVVVVDVLVVVAGGTVVVAGWTVVVGAAVVVVDVDEVGDVGAWTVNGAAESFQCNSPVQWAPKIPILTTWAPAGSLTGTVHESLYVRTRPALNACCSQKR